MRTVRDVMTAETVSVGPKSTVHAAVLLLRSRGLLVLPVVEGNELLGVVDAATLFMYQPDIIVSDVMAGPASVQTDDSLSTAAAAMRAHCLPEMPVVDDGLVGVLKASSLLNAWAMPVDPLTGLSWQDSFRLRSAMQLASGNELTLLFFDMDDFGALNKRFGHIVGDRALQAVARALKDAMDPGQDEACRFGGDEFVVSTTRPRAEAVEWAATVRQAVLETPVDGMGHQLSVSVGVAGGLRHGERPGTHGPATLDDLINRASQASTLAKTSADGMMSLEAEQGREPVPLITPTPLPIPPPTSPPTSPPTMPSITPSIPHSPAPAAPRILDFPARPVRIRIRGVSTHAGAGRTRADVRLERTGIVSTGTWEGPEADEPAVVAEAAAQALAHFLPSRYCIQPTYVAEQACGGRERVMMAMVRLDGPHGRQNLVGVADSTSDPRRAAVKAVLDAVNRPLEAIVPSAEISPLIADPRRAGSPQ